MGKDLIPGWLKKWYLSVLAPGVRWFTSLRIHPNVFTSLSLAVSAASAVAFAAGSLVWGGILVLFSGTFDIVDGAVARASGRSSKFGALFDSSLDRYAEFFVLIGVLVYFIQQDYDVLLSVLVVGAALCGSFMVSYVRARAEGLGFECKVGWMQRPERIVLLGFGSIIHEYALMAVLVLIAILSNLTAIQRMVYIAEISRPAR
ncbi:MAG: CDP-alcohol phosphatidyltransferase family protein [Candidatus Omnitrophota bacterium]|nr:CDP-alcohol phosphatidyltransferase family protein [Candidatus Omnitrophota bacterium]MDZ4241719.1 CDP-alcohol phosphatidyltransferase family protein [Candidatus Omnitrophota bacterium]